MKKRVISAIVMILVFIPFLILGDTFYLVLGGILGVLSLWELMRLEKNIPSYMQFLSYIVCLLLVLYKHDSKDYLDILNFPIVVSMFFIYSFSIIINNDLKKYNYKDSLWLFCITLMIGLMFNSFIKVRYLGLYDVIYCMLIATMTDTFALFGGKLFGKNKLIANTGENRLEENMEVSDKLKVVSDVLYELTNSKDAKIEEFEDLFVKEFIENINDIKKNIFYDVIINSQSKIAKDICNCIQIKEIIVDNDLVEILRKYDNYIFVKDEIIKENIKEIIRIANRTYKIVQINIAKIQERNENLNTISKSLKDVSKVIDECAKEIVDEKENKFLKKQKELEILLKNKNILVKKCNINQIKNGKYIIKLFFDNNERIKNKDVITNISDIISKSLGTKVNFQREKTDVSNEKYFQMYASEDKYIMQVGSAKIAKDSSDASGDCNLQIKLEDGKYLLAICDGMGSGE